MPLMQEGMNITANNLCRKLFLLSFSLLYYCCLSMYLLVWFVFCLRLLSYSWSLGRHICCRRGPLWLAACLLHALVFHLCLQKQRQYVYVLAGEGGTGFKSSTIQGIACTAGALIHFQCFWILHIFYYHCLRVLWNILHVIKFAL